MNSMEILEEIGTGSSALYAYSFPSQIEGERWPVKIARAHKPFSRIREQQASMQEEPTILLIFWNDHPVWTEQTVHSALAPHKLDTFGKEWFDTNTDEIRSLLKPPSYVEKSVVRSERQFGYQVRMHRTLKGMTQTDLSKVAGVRVATISAVENGKRCTSTMMFRLLAALNMELTARPRTVVPYDEMLR